jgi:SAM-dependent methyltransferase
VSGPSGDQGSIERAERQRSFWRGKYAEDPTFFGDRESDFARWSLPLLRAEGDVRGIVELGCGYGRDARYLAAHGFRVRAVDLTAEAARADLRSRDFPGVEFVETDALGYLSEQEPGSVDAVYSNMFFNMEFTEADHRRLMTAVRRALRPRGLHLYSARSTSDPWYGRGTPVGPDTFDPAPFGVPMHYISREYADRLARGLFDPVRREERAEGEPDFPMRLLYVADRRTA